MIVFVLCNIFMPEKPVNTGFWAVFVLKYECRRPWKALILPLKHRFCVRHKFPFLQIVNEQCFGANPEFWCIFGASQRFWCKCKNLHHEKTPHTVSGEGSQVLDLFYFGTVHQRKHRPLIVVDRRLFDDRRPQALAEFIKRPAPLFHCVHKSREHRALPFSGVLLSF